MCENNDFTKHVDASNNQADIHWEIYIYIYIYIILHWDTLVSCKLTHSDKYFD